MCTVSGLERKFAKWYLFHAPTCLCAKHETQEDLAKEERCLMLERLGGHGKSLLPPPLMASAARVAWILAELKCGRRAKLRVSSWASQITVHSTLVRVQVPQHLIAFAITMLEHFQADLAHWHTVDHGHKDSVGNSRVSFAARPRSRAATLVMITKMPIMIRKMGFPMMTMMLATIADLVVALLRVHLRSFIVDG